MSYLNSDSTVFVVLGLNMIIILLLFYFVSKLPELLLVVEEIRGRRGFLTLLVKCSLNVNTERCVTIYFSDFFFNVLHHANFEVQNPKSD